MTLDALASAYRAFRDALPNPARIYLGGGHGAPTLLAELFHAYPDLCADTCFIGAWIPGINTTDWTAFHPSTTGETTFLSDPWRRAHCDGKLQLLPLGYSQTWRWFGETKLDGAILVGAPGQSSDSFCLSLSPDFGPQLAARPGLPLLGLINLALPTGLNSVTVPMERFSCMAEIEAPLQISAPAQTSATHEAIGKHVASLIEDGDTLQFGIGSIPAATLNALAHHKDLSFHSGLIGDEVRQLADCGAVADRPGAILSGLAFGSSELYSALSGDPRYVLRAVNVTHSTAILGQLPNFKAINSALQIDLTGQVNAEFAGERQISGLGGSADFARGAAASPGGRSILAFPSTAQKGQVSRIVPALTNQRLTLSRYDVDTVVTEHGIAELKGLSEEDRARALIRIADPAFRDPLASSLRTAH